MNCGLIFWFVRADCRLFSNEAADGHGAGRLQKGWISFCTWPGYSCILIIYHSNLKSCVQALELSPKDWNIHSRLALVYFAGGMELFNQGDYSSAEAQFSKVGSSFAAFGKQHFTTESTLSFTVCAVYFQAIHHNWKVPAFFVHRGHCHFYQQV